MCRESDVKRIRTVKSGRASKRTLFINSATVRMVHYRLNLSEDRLSLQNNIRYKKISI